MKYLPISRIWRVVIEAFLHILLLALIVELWMGITFLPLLYDMFLSSGDLERAQGVADTIALYRWLLPLAVVVYLLLLSKSVFTFYRWRKSEGGPNTSKE